MRYTMLNLIPHHRLHVPNGLAVLAAVLLLAISVANFNSGSNTDPSGAKTSHAAPVESSESENINDGIVSKRRGLNLGSLLFRR